ncbi:MAG TPA: hypothetical protein VFZ26_05040 [Gemmatimonadales bacterium]
MKLERVFPLEDPPVELPWGLSRSGVEALLRGAETGSLPDGRLRVQCRLLGGLTTTVDLHFGPGRQRRLRLVEVLRKPVRHKRKEFNDMQRRLEAWLGPADAMESNPAARAQNIAPQQWRIGKLHVTHDYYFESALYEKVLFSWMG